MKKTLSLLLCLSLLLGMFAFAEEAVPAQQEELFAGEPEVVEAFLEEDDVEAEAEPDPDGAEPDLPAEEPEVEVEAEDAPAEDALVSAELEAEVVAEDEAAGPEEAGDLALEESLDPAELEEPAAGEGAEEDAGEADGSVEEPEVAEAASIVYINAANFPDAIFRKYVNNKLAGGKGYLTASDIASIKVISVEDEDIRDLTGIRFFSSVEYVYCYWNYIRNLDVSYMSSLKSLYCYDNRLESLNVSGCTNLRELCCCLNDKLSYLNVSSCTRLEYLECGEGDGFTLEVGNNTAILNTLTNANLLSHVEGYGRFIRDNDAYRIYFPVGGRVTRYGSTVFTYQPTLKLQAKSLKLGVKEKFTLVKGGKQVYRPDECTFKSSNKRVAKVSAGGVITPLKPGTATITVKVKSRYGSASATCKVTVKKAPSKVAFTVSKKTVRMGRTATLKVKFPGGSFSRKRTFKSSNTAVATVNSKGVVTAKKVGTATITVRTFNGRKGTCKITVTRGYQALLVGQPGIYGDGGESSTRFATDVSIMKKALERRKAPQGTYKGHITVKKNVNQSQLYSAIQTMASKARSSDVTLFFIATHGYTYGTGSVAGALAMYDDYAITFGTLASWLKQIPGKVVVVISSCGSGAAVYANGASDDGEPERLNQAAIDAFRDADGAGPADIDANTGELRNSKFYVITSSAYQQTSWGRESAPDKGDWFVKMIRDGVGSGSSMPADANRNRVLTLNELKNYIDKRERTARLGPNGYSRQFVQIYPEGSGYKLLKR